MRSRTRLAAVWLLLWIAAATAQQPALGPAEQIADGVLLYRLHDPALLSPPAPVSVQALRLDPRRVILETRQAGDGGAPARERVDAIAARRGAIAAVNAGFFSLETGRPTALLKTGGRVVHGTSRARGAVGIVDQRGITRLLFDRVTVATRGLKRPEVQDTPGNTG